jgi:DNA-directed RNA polymerase subunit alpha
MKVTEAELLSYKNFGETSLREIKVVLDSKGLRLGMALDEKELAAGEIDDSSVEEDADKELLDKPVDELRLSVRARKCLERLDICTLGDLTRRTDAELLGCKNFGVTSLNEIRKALTNFGLSLRSLD